jgi:hypothetical protein
MVVNKVDRRWCRVLHEKLCCEEQDCSPKMCSLHLNVNLYMVEFGTMPFDSR